MRVIKKETIRFKDVVPETIEEKEDIERIIKEVTENDPFEPDKLTKVDHRKKD